MQPLISTWNEAFTTSEQYNAIELENLVCAYGKLVVVNNLSLRVPVGSVYGFLGPNGAGKTTTIKTLLGMRPLQGGQATVLGYDISTQSQEALKRISYMPETPNLYAFMCVHEMTETARHLSARWNSKALDQYLALFGLPRKSKISQLSKGMKGQLALAIALASEPDLLILDEPTSGLDPLKRYDFLNQIVREVSSAGRTIFFSSHNLNEVEQIADRICIINEGKLVLEDDLDELKAREKSVKVGFDNPISIEETEKLSKLPYVRKVLQEGRRYRLLVSGNAEEVVHSLRQMGARTVDIVDMNLETIFISYLR
jgi:ABC-2 type transport system ATP-binding protein